MATTQNYHLPQFDGSDRIHHDDFNAAFAAIDTAMAGKGECKIAIGSYIGTGESGVEHPNTLQFDFVPLLVIVNGDTEYKYRIIANRGCGKSFSDLSGNTNCGRLQLTWGERSLTWYCSSAASYFPVDGQLNKSGATYSYVALGTAE